MSKSAGNFFTIRQVLEHVEPEALRYYLLGTHYRAPIGFDVAIDEQGGLIGFPGLEDAERRVAYCYGTLQRMGERLAEPAEKAAMPAPFEAELEGFDAKLEGAMDDDLNTAAALGHVADLFRIANDLCDRQGKKQAPGVRKQLSRIRELLGPVSATLGLFTDDPASFIARRAGRILARRGLASAEIDRRVADRTAARSAKQFDRADEIRASLERDGIELMDGPRGTVWRVA